MNLLLLVQFGEELTEHELLQVQDTWYGTKIKTESYHTWL